MGTGATTASVSNRRPQPGPGPAPSVDQLLQSGAVTTQEGPEEPESYEFYCPQHPNEAIAIPGSYRRIQFVNGTFRTDDPAVAQQVRAANRYGMYLEADMPRHVTCFRCGWPTRSTKAIELHYATHME